MFRSISSRIVLALNNAIESQLEEPVQPELPAARNAHQSRNEDKNRKNEEIPDKWIYLTEDTVTSVAANVDFIAWSTQNQQLKYSVFVKKLIDLPGTVYDNLETHAIVQDMAFTSVSALMDRLVCADFNGYVYIVDLHQITGDGARVSWTSTHHVPGVGNPISVAICSGVFSPIDCVGIGTTLGYVKLLQYSESGVFSDISSIPRFPEKVLGIEFLVGEICRLVVAEKLGNLTIFVVITDSAGHQILNFQKEFQHTLNLNVECGRMICSADSGERFVVACGDEKARVYNLSKSGKVGGEEYACTWEVIHTVDLSTVPACISLSGDGNTVCVGENDEASVFDIDSGSQIHSFKIEGRIKTVFLDQNGEMLLVGGFDKKIRLYNIYSGFDKTKTFELKCGNIQSVSLDDAGTLIAFGTSTGHVYVYALPFEESMQTACSHISVEESGSHSVVFHEKTENSEQIYVVKLSPDGKILGYGSYSHEAKLYKLSLTDNNHTFLFRHGPDQGYIGPPAFVWGLDIKINETSYVVAIGCWNNNASVYRFNKKTFQRDACTLNFIQEDRVFDVCLSNSGDTLVVGGRDKKVRLYNLTDKLLSQDISVNECFQEFDDADRVYCVAISPNGQHIAYGGVHKEVRVYQLGVHTKASSPVPKQRFLHCNIVHRVKFIDDNHLAAVSEDGRCAIYNVDSPSTLTQLTFNSAGNSLAFTFYELHHILAIAHGKFVTVYGKYFGYGPLDRPSISLAESMLSDVQSLKITLETHPTLTNAFENGRTGSLLMTAVQDNNMEAIESLLNCKVKSGFIIKQDNSNHCSPLTIALSNKNRNLIQVLLTAINSGKIIRNNSLFINGLFSICNISDKSRKRTVFEAVGELCPETLLKFLSSFELESCDPELLQDLECAPISSEIYVGLPFKAPKGFWNEYFKVSKRNEVTRTVNIPERLVEALIIPIPGIGGHVFEGNPSVRTPLEVIVEAAGAVNDFSAFQKGTIVHALVMFEWTKVRSRFKIVSFNYLAYLSCCMYLSWNVADTSRKDSPYSNLALLVSVGLFFASFYYIKREFCQILTEFNICQAQPALSIRLQTALFRHFCNDPWNVLDCMAFGSQLVTDVMIMTSSEHFQQLADALILLSNFQPNMDRRMICQKMERYIASWAAISILLLFLKVLFYARAYHLLGPFVRMIQRTFEGMSRFLLVMIIFLFGFALAFSILLNDVEGFETWYDSMLTTTLMLYGDFGKFDSPKTSIHKSGLVALFFQLMMFTCSVTMLNLLVAIMSDSFAEVKENSFQEFIFQLANIIIETQKIDKQVDKDTLLFQKWVHILKPTETKTIIENESELSILKTDLKGMLTELMNKQAERVEILSKQSEKQSILMLELSEKIARLEQNL